jgi:ribosome-binding protein aMBF1 (putative translation factor)
MKSNVKRQSAKATNTSSDGGAILRKRYLAHNRELGRLVADHRVNLEIAQQIYDLRTKSGYTQEELARLVKTTPSVISRLEDADYEGHSLSMLKRIAAALGKRVVVKFVNDVPPRVV